MTFLLSIKMSKNSIYLIIPNFYTKFIATVVIMDKEQLVLESVVDKYGDDEGLPLNYFLLQIQSLNEDEYFWLDSGAFNLSITTL